MNPHRNLITDRSHTFGTILIAQFHYQNDALGRRTKRIDTAGLNSVTNDFAYNIKNELTSAVMNTNLFGYQYDEIGNRLSSTSSVSSVYSVVNYVSNPLNQYTNITSSSVVESPMYKLRRMFGDECGLDVGLER